MDFELSDLGGKQAALAGEALKGETFDIAYSSDLKRAYDTACAIVRENPYFDGLLQGDILLREQKKGIMEGKSNQEIRQIFEDERKTNPEVRVTETLLFSPVQKHVIL